jgi:hypothetical protein
MCVHLIMSRLGVVTVPPESSGSLANIAQARVRDGGSRIIKLGNLPYARFGLRSVRGASCIDGRQGRVPGLGTDAA